MSDRFQSPEPSPKAHAAAATIINDTVDQLGGFDAGGDALRAAYAIDFPAIVRREVQEALSHTLGDLSFPYNRTRVKAREYVARRFGGCICTGAHVPTCPLYIAGSGEPARFGEGETLPPSSGPSPYPSCAHVLVSQPSGVCINCGDLTRAFREPMGDSLRDLAPSAPYSHRITSPASGGGSGPTRASWGSPRSCGSPSGGWGADDAEEA